MDCVGDGRIYLLTGQDQGQWLDNKSRMNREVHVRFCERLWGWFPGPTRPSRQLTQGVNSQNIGLKLKEKAWISSR
jgi:hypothetical protein